MQLEEFKRNRFVRNFMRDRWMILSTAGIILVFAVLFVTLVYKPKYTSEAKVWLKDTSSGGYLTSDAGGGPSYLRPLSSGSNPVMAQVQILNSNEMADYLAQYVYDHQRIANHGRLPRASASSLADLREQTPGIIKIKTEPNNDLIEVKLSWTNPAMAREMLSAALARFDGQNLDINRNIYTKKRAYLAGRLADIRGKLANVRNRLRDYQAGTMAVDVDTQTQELVRLRAQLEAQLASVTAASGNNASFAGTLQRQLRMSPATALQAVALGSGNENLVKLRSDLDVLKQQLAHDSVKMAPTNPQLLALRNQIAALEGQIRDEVRSTVGKVSANGPRIYDSVRGQLVQDLASARARSVGLGSEASSLRSAIARVDESLKAIPGSKYELANLQEEERTLAQAYDELRTKEIDASIREAETPSNVFVVDAPTVPERASFPSPLHMLALSMLLGLMAGFGLSTLKTITEDRAEGSEAIAEATRGKILGVLPWLGGAARTLPKISNDNISSISDVAVKHLVSNLRIEAAGQGAEVIAFTSSSLRKPVVGTVYGLAQRLSKLGHSVVLVDTDARASLLHQMVADSAAGVDLAELILDADRKLAKGQPLPPEDLINGLRRDPNGVYLAINRQELDHAYDYFASRGFRYVLDILKAQFDWVFVDTPSASIAPEFAAIASMTDGVVLFADHRATFSELRRIAAKIRNSRVPLIGTVVRERNKQLEREHIHYLRRGGGSGGGLAPTAGTLPLSARRVEFMGAKIDALSMRETVARIDEIITRREQVQHVVVNVAKLMAMRNDSQLRAIVNGSPLVNADGIGVVWGARLLGLDIPERVTGIDLMQEVVQLAHRKGYRIFFLGAEEDVVRDVVTGYKRRMPGLQVCGYRNGYFQPADELEVAMQIREAKPDILFVGMGSPRKEKFISKYKDDFNVPFVMGVGGSFDVLAGKVRRAPRWMQRAGLEWFYRFAQEPGRMWKRYLVTNAQYGFALAGGISSALLDRVNDDDRFSDDLRSTVNG